VFVRLVMMASILGNRARAWPLASNPNEAVAGSAAPTRANVDGGCASFESVLAVESCGSGAFNCV